LTEEVRLRIVKARTLLAQARRLDPNRDAEGVIHLSYYAMYHAAVAVLLARSRTVPTRHSSVIGRFGLLAKKLGDEAREAGRTINRAFDLRLLADYDVAAQDLGEDARIIRGKATRFLKTCERLTATARGRSR